MMGTIAEIEANESRAEALVLGLSNQQFNWRAEPGRWSIAQCLSHLNVINGLDLTPLREGIRAGRARNLTGPGPFTYGLISRKFVASMEPPVTRKFKAPAAYVPPPEADLARTIGEYRRISEEVRQLAEASAGLDLTKVKISMPALPAILRAFVKMPLGARFSLLTAHDRRHLWQADQVRQHPAFPHSHS